MRENISRSKSIRRQREDAEKFNFRPMLSKKSMHLAAQMKPANARLVERVAQDLQQQKVFENLECTADETQRTPARAEESRAGRSASDPR